MSRSAGAAPTSNHAMYNPATRTAGEFETFMTTLSQNLALYLQSPVEHPVWDPPAEYDGAPSWDAANIKRLQSLSIPHIPSYATSKSPDMILYSIGSLGRLDPSFPERLTQLVSDQQHLYVSNASGTGKTRLLLEVLAAHWGFYFSCTADDIVDPYGSRDLTTALNVISSTRIGTDSLYYPIPFTNVVPRNARWRVVHNRLVAHHCVQLVVLARLMIFKAFCEALANSALPESTARMKWVLLQLRPQLYLKTDVFFALVLHLHHLDDTTIKQRISSLYATTKFKIAFVAIDETNVALRKYPAMFATTDYHRLTPVFRELVACMATNYPNSRLLIAGTELDMELARDAVRSSGSSFRSVALFHSLGHFATLERTSAYLRHFLGNTVSGSLCKTAHTWFRGRHRFLAVFVMHTLNYGLGRAVQVLDTIVHAFTQYRRPGSKFVDQIYLGVGFPDERLEASPLAVRLRHAGLNFMLHRQPTTFTTDALALVSFGAALYDGNAPHALFFEPLIFIGIARWLHTSVRYGIHGIIRARLQDPIFPIQEASLAEGLAACFCNILTSNSPPPLRSFLRFSGPDPAFVRDWMQLLLPRLSQRRRSAQFQSGLFTSEACLQVASSAEDVFRWFNEASRPFLIPDADCGPDLIFAAQLAGARKVLVCVQSRPFPSNRTRRGVKIVPLRPNEFYNSLPEARERFLSYLAMFEPPSSASSKKEHQQKIFTKYSALHLLCFAEAYRSDESYDPPVATIDFSYLVQQARPTEFELSQAAASIEDSASMDV